MSSLKNLVKFLFGRSLVVTNSLASGCLMGTGDVVAQCIEKKNCNLKDLDLKRTGRFVVFGLCMGPLNHLWYSYLDRILPQLTRKVIIKKLALDQCVSGSLNITAFFIGLNALEGKSIWQGTADVKNNFWNVLKVDIALWPAAQLINFYWVPRQYRMLYVCLIALGWNTFLAHYKQKHTSGDHAEVKVKAWSSPSKQLPAYTHMSMSNNFIHKIKKIELTDKQEKNIISKTKKIIAHVKV